MEILMIDVVRCPVCDEWFAECSVEGDPLPNIVQHCYEEHPDSVIATAIRAALEDRQ